MKRGICGLFAAVLVLTSTLTERAWAQKGRKVVVEQMNGRGAPKLRQMVITTLARKGVDVVSDKRLATAEADLGLLQSSDNYPAAAKELKVVAFIGGSVSGGKRLTAKVRVKGADGTTLGEAAWRGTKLPKLLATVNRTLPKQLMGILASAKGRHEEVASDDEAPTTKSKRAAVEEDILASAPEPAASSRETSSRETPTRETTAREERSDKTDQFEQAEAAPPPETRSRKRRRTDDDEVTVADRDDRRPSKRTAVKNLDVAVGAHIYGRQFRYNQNVAGGAQEYQLPVVPAPSVALDYFVVPYLGLTVGGEYSVGLVSEDSAGNRYRTSSFGYWAGLKGRYLISKSSEITATAAYAGNSFAVNPETAETAATPVAGVSYKQVRLGAAGRAELSDSVSLIGGADYLHLLGMGGLQSADFFPYATGRGGQGFAGLAIRLPWMAGLEARATLDIRRYVFSMNSQDGDKRIAGGATDQYIGGNLSFGLRQ